MSFQVHLLMTFKTQILKLLFTPIRTWFKIKIIWPVFCACFSSANGIVSLINTVAQWFLRCSDAYLIWFSESSPPTKKAILHFLFWSSLLGFQSYLPKITWASSGLILQDLGSFPTLTSGIYLIRDCSIYRSAYGWSLLNSLEFFMLSWADSNPLSFIFCVWFFSFTF